VAADFLIANEAANQAEDDDNTANQIMFDTFQRFVDAVGFGFDADCVDVARLVVNLTKNETNVSKMSEFPESGNVVELENIRVAAERVWKAYEADDWDEHQASWEALGEALDLCPNGDLGSHKAGARLTDV